MALSEDDTADAVDTAAGQAQRRPKPKVSKRAAAREAAGGTGRSPSFTIPTPINCKAEGAGYQQYRLPDDTRVYQRRQFKYEDEFKVGPLLSVRPGPPTLFSDKYLFIASKKILGAEADPDEEEFDYPARLVRRLEARIVRISLGYFISQDLSEHPTEEAVIAANDNMALVFGAGSTGWTQKQVMAWAWPEIAIIGDALRHYQGGALALQQRDTARLLGICLLTAPNGTASYKSIVGIENRFERLTGDLRIVADTLSSVVREGLLTAPNAGPTIVRQDLNLSVLFGDIEATHGKDAPPTSQETYKEGDAVTIKLFDHGMDDEDEDGETTTEWQEVEQSPACARVPAHPPVYMPTAVCPMPTQVAGAADEGWLEMDMEQLFLYRLGEAALNKMLTAIEIALPTKKKVYTGQKKGSGSGGPGVSRLSKHGRRAVKLLKKVLPKVRQNELKLMLTSLKPEADVSGSKEDLVLALLQGILPG